MELKIEKGVPPPSNQRDATTQASIVRSMEEGDSVFFADAKSAGSFGSILNYHTKNTEFCQRVRKVEGGYRVWKVKREPKPNGSTS